MLKIYGLLIFCILCTVDPVRGQWLDWQSETEVRLELTSVADSDDEEKDMAAGDLNQDGLTDLVVVRKTPFSFPFEPPKSDLLLINVDGRLIDQTEVYAPEFLAEETLSFARDVIIADLDDDGWVDVIIANTFGQQPMYYRNLGNDADGHWLGLANESTDRFPTLTDPLFCAVWAEDIDGDDDLDLYFVNYDDPFGADPQGVAFDYLLINNGNGVFTDESEDRLGDLRNSAFGTSVEIHDVDDDGDNDIVKISTLYPVEPWNNVGLIVLFNEGAGTFTQWQNLAPFSPYMFTVGDFDDNGFLDYVVVDDLTDYVLSVTAVDPDVSLTTSRQLLDGITELSFFGGNIHAADLDNDGDLDVGISDVDVDIPPCISDRQMVILENQEGTFVDRYAGEEEGWETNSYDFAFIDINNDGLTDFISGGCAGYHLYMNQTCALASGSADFDLDGIPDACDECPTNPDPSCTPPTEYPEVSLDHSVARQWNELLLASIRWDFARPTVHARNLFHTSIAMWDAWATYDENAENYLLGETLDGFTCDFNGINIQTTIRSAREETLSYAAYRLLSHRFVNSPRAALLQQAYDAHMTKLGYDITFASEDYSGGSPAALGNYLARCIIDYGLQDGANEQNEYGNTVYAPVNDPLIVDVAGNPDITDLNRWQPLTLDLFIDQSGNEIPGETPEFLSPEWGQVYSFALSDDDLTTRERDGFDYRIYHDPGAPPYINTNDGSGTTEDYRWGFTSVITWSSHLDATDGVMWDISPGAIGNRNELPETVDQYEDFYDLLAGGTTGDGHPINPATNQPYTPNMVPRADYARVLAEFWADGPDSETPPGHWFTILNYVSDHSDLSKQLQGEGALLDDLEWDVKTYLTLGGAMHDAAISAWGIKGWYDYIRPISAIRAMAALGQSTDDLLPSYHVGGLSLITDYIELVEAGDELAGEGDINVGKIKVRAWRGHNAINNVDSDEAGVGWILAENWEPYQRPSFVTPPFAGYVSGHSTYSRAAAEVLSRLTGDAYFPGGMGVFEAPQDEFLVFEDGPSVDVQLQWATYQDAADESALSRIWGGIHPPADDIPGRRIGIEVGNDAFDKAITYFSSEQDHQPEIEITLAGNDLTSQDQVSFGTPAVGETSGPLLFTITNTGTNYLSLSGEPVIALSGSAASQFEVTQPTTSTVSVGGSTTFSVVFRPQTMGVHSAELILSSNDSDEGTFILRLEGNGTGPILRVMMDEEQVLHGGEAAFGMVEVGNYLEKTFTLTNQGSGTLTFERAPALTADGMHDPYFNLPSLDWPSQLGPGEEMALTMTYEPDSEGVHQAQFNLESNDLAHPHYQVMLSGRAQVVAGLGEEPGTGEGLLLYPVPAQDVVRIETDLEGPVTFGLYDLTGRTAKGGTVELREGRGSLSVTGLEDGYYVLTLQQGVILRRAYLVKQ